MDTITIQDVGGGETLQRIGPFMYIEAECHVWCVPVYSKCSFRCTYCNTEAQGKSKPAFSKESIPAMLAAFKPHANIRPLLVGAESDPYPPEEKELRITRYFLQQLTEQGIHFRLVTKGDAVLNDIDILRDNPCVDLISITLTNTDNQFLKHHESGAPDYETRLNVVHRLHEVGIPVAVSICPWMPELTPVEKIVNELPDIPITLGVLTYNQHAKNYIKYLYGVDTSSAERVFGKTWTQAELTEAYLADYERLKDILPRNVRWVHPPGSGSRFSAFMPPSIHKARKKTASQSTD